MNVDERYKPVTFISYPHENKDPMNVMNVARKYFAGRARELPMDTNDCLPSETRTRLNRSEHKTTNEPSWDSIPLCCSS